MPLPGPGSDRRSVMGRRERLLQGTSPIPFISKTWLRTGLSSHCARWYEPGAHRVTMRDAKSPVTKYLTVQPRNCSVRATPNVPQLPHFRHDEPVHLPSSAFQAFVCAFDRCDAAREVTRMGGSLYLPLWSSEAFLVIQASPGRVDIQPRRVSP